MMESANIAHMAKALEALIAVRRYFPDAILAGGFLRDVLTGREPKDIDLFIPSPDLRQVVHFEVDMGARKAVDATEYIEQGEIASIWNVPGFGLPVQVISLKLGLYPVDRAKSHDFGICQVWFDGESIQATDNFHLDRNEMRFTLVSCEDQREFDRSMRRWDRLKDKFAGWTLAVADEFSHYHEATFR